MKLQHRAIQPEWLDLLPSNDPRAIRSRRDLQRINAWMGNAGWVARAMQQIPWTAPPRRLVDLGAGDGSLVSRIAHRMSGRWPRLETVLVDRSPCLTPTIQDAIEHQGWTVQTVSADVFSWLPSQPESLADVILCNLFLHHFSADALPGLLRSAAERTRCLIACEPERGRLPLAAARLLWWIGCSAETRHDATVSVAAGFKDRELAPLWPASKEWRLQEFRAGWFSHVFLAVHRSLNGTQGP